MKCRHPGELISAYVDGELSAGERLATALLLGRCASCRKALVSLERSRSALAAASAAPMPRGLAGRLEAMIDKEVPVPEPRRLRPRLSDFWIPEPSWVLAGAAAVAVGLFAAAGSMMAPAAGPKVPLERLLAEHLRSTRKSVDVHRGIIAASPFVEGFRAGARTQ